MISTLKQQQKESKEKVIRAIPLAVAQAGKLIKGDLLNRQRLAATVGVSTKTLQKIVEARVPDLVSSTNQKELKAWIRAFVRIARYFGRDAEKWIRSMGISWDIGMERFALAAKPLNFEIPNRPVFDIVLDSIRRSGAVEKEQTVRVRLVAYPPFHDGGKESFYSRFTDELVGSINPLWRVEFETFFRIEETIDALLKNPDECHLVVGLFDTRPRRLRGVDFVNIPGWEIPLGGICWKRPESPSPTWQQVKDAAYAEEHFQVMVVEGEAGHNFLKGDCRYPDAIIEPVPRLDIGQIVNEFRKLGDLYATSSKTSLFIADENLCRAIWTDIKKSKDGPSLGIVKASRSPIDQPPAYKIGLAVRADARSWREILEIARDETMFGTRLANTASLYAEVILKGLTLLRLEEDFASSSERSSWKPVDFLLPTDKANEVFRLEIVKHLKAKFEKERPQDQLRSKITALLPEQWRESVDSAISPAVPLPQSEAIARIENLLQDSSRALKQLRANLKE